MRKESPARLQHFQIPDSHKDSREQEKARGECAQMKDECRISVGFEALSCLSKPFFLDAANYVKYQVALAGNV